MTVIDTPPKRRTRGAPADLGAILADMAQRGGGTRLRQASVGAAIADAVGPYLARRLTGVWLDGERCRVETPDAEAARQLARHVPILLDRLRGRLGALAPTSIDVRRVVAARPAAAQPRRAERVSAVPGERPLTEAALEDIADPADRERLARWARGRGRGHSPFG